jgi:hypothetical protein
MPAAIHSIDTRSTETPPHPTAAIVAHYQAIIAGLEAQLADTRRELLSCRSVYRALLEAASFKDLLK